MYSLPENLAIIAAPVFAWWALHRACGEFWHRSWIANAVFGALFVIGAVLSMVDELRKRREAHAHLAMQFPMCHITRLSTGNWLLTDRATGREYVGPGKEAANA